MDRPEYFRFGPYRFDVAELRRRIEAGTLLFQRFDWHIVEWAEHSLGLARAHPERRPETMGAWIDYDYLPQIDAERLKEPVLVAATPIGNMLIDGHHRVARAYLTGIDVLPAIMIEHDGGVPRTQPTTRQRSK